MKTRALIVGAGAVGQVYGGALAHGGYEVGCLVKPRYAREARAGFTLLPVQGDPWSWTPSVVLDAPVEVARVRWDQIWLCVSSTALRGPWLAELLAAAPEAVIVGMQPGLTDGAWLLEQVGPERLVSGLIGFSAWTAPLPGQQGPTGLGYWTPPLLKSRFSGPAPVTGELVDALRRGGLPAALSSDADRDGALGSAILLTTIAALEIAGWTFPAWRRDPISQVGAAAAREALSIAGAHHGVPVWHVQMIVRRRLLSLALRVASAASPMSLETFFRVHFSKVGDQTRAALDTWIAAGRAHGLATEALVALAAQMPRS